jgi:hypothetical protein
MVLCGYCRENVTPKMYLTWKRFIYGLGVFYLIYLFLKIPQCPNCNFPMPRRRMVFVIPSQLIKSARNSVSKLIYLKNKLIYACRNSNQNRKLDPFQYFGSVNTNRITSFNMIADKVHNFIGLDSDKLRK